MPESIFGDIRLPPLFLPVIVGKSFCPYIADFNQISSVLAKCKKWQDIRPSEGDNQSTIHGWLAFWSESTSKWMVPKGA